jgi:hypothetical protein
MAFNMENVLVPSVVIETIAREVALLIANGSPIYVPARDLNPPVVVAPGGV